jgi:hypothetical protein
MSPSGFSEMKLLTGIVSLTVGVAVGITVLAAAASLLPGLVVNLGLHGTLLCVVSTLVVAIPWLRKRATLASADRPSVGSMLARAFAVGVAFRVLLELGFVVFGVANPEQMTWGNQVVIAGGRRTLEGWVLLVRGCIESGLAGLVLCGAVAIVAELIDRIRGLRAA